jgi:hypothetical protein
MKPETESKFTFDPKPRTIGTSPQSMSSMPFSVSDFTMEPKKYVSHDDNIWHIFAPLLMKPRGQNARPNVI